MYDSITKLSYVATTALLAYILLLAIYRLYFHRTSHIPGPKLAALTYLYQTYYDVCPYQGRWLWQCEALHKRYGPIIRVGPDEIHINDPAYYDEVW